MSLEYKDMAKILLKHILNVAIDKQFKEIYFKMQQ